MPNVENYTTNANRASAGVLFTQDCSEFTTVAVRVNDAGSGNTIAYEVSDTGLDADFIPHPTTGSVTATGRTVLALTTAFFRARISTYGSGTPDVTATFRA